MELNEAVCLMPSRTRLPCGNVKLTMRVKAKQARSPPIPPATCAALTSHGLLHSTRTEGTRSGLGRRLTGAPREQTHGRQEEGRGDRSAAPADRATILPPVSNVLGNRDK